MSKPKTSLLIASALAALGITTGTYVARQIVMVSPPPVMPANPVDPGGGDTGPIPEERLVDWTPGTHVGVVGGIPTGRTQCVTTECQAVTNAASGYKDGTLDPSTLINAAIASCLANTYVLVPAGTWRHASAISIGQADDNCTVRGASRSTTIFDCRVASGQSCWLVGTGFTFNYPPSAVVSGYAESGDNTVLTVSDTSEIGGAGTVVRLLIDDDPTIPIVNTGSFLHNRQQLTKVVSKTAGSVTVFPPVYGYDGLAGISSLLYSASWDTSGVGIEDLTIDASLGSADDAGRGINYQNCTNCWVQNATIVGVVNYPIAIADSMFMEIRKSTMQQLNGAGSNGAGILVNSVSASLFEDNILTQNFPGIEMNAGSSGNVIAYNFVHHTNGAMHGINVNHGPFNTYNLLEGNVTSNTLSDGLFGGEGWTTYFRNLIHGNGINCAFDVSYCANGPNGTGTDSGSWVMAVKRFGRYSTAVGNVMGVNGVHTGGVFSLGDPNIGNGGSAGTAQPSLGDFWEDWNATDGHTRTGTLTRTSDCVGSVAIPLNALANWAPQTAGDVYLRPLAGSLESYATFKIGTITSTTMPITSCLNGVLPAAGAVKFSSYNGFQEIDLDVDETLFRTDNYIGTTAAIDTASGETVPDSLFRSAKPSWFNGLTWPPVDPDSPVYDYEIIPAGYRYMNAGSDPP